VFVALGIQDSAVLGRRQAEKIGLPVDKSVGYFGVSFAKPRSCWDSPLYTVRRGGRRFFAVPERDFLVNHTNTRCRVFLGAVGLFREGAAPAFSAVPGAGPGCPQ
jgi:hypothetical protein